MIRISKHTLKFSNKKKLEIISMMYEEYANILQVYVNMILSKQLILRSFLSSKELPNVRMITHSRWKQLAYKQASEIVRSVLVKTKKKTFKRYQYLYSYCKRNNIHHSFLNKKYSELNINYLKRLPKIKVKNISIALDQRFINFKSGNNFDEFIKLTTPYFKLNKHRTIKINLPIKHHRQSLKFKNDNWNQKKTVLLIKKKNMFYINLFWEKELKPKSNGTKQVGIDLGYKKLISSTSGKHYGKELFKIYQKISRKEQGSKSFKKTLIERNELINFYTKQFINNESPDELFVERLENVKRSSKGKIYKKTMNKLQRWSYSKTLAKINSLSETEGFVVKEVSPAFTSQTCSNCGNIHKKSRNGETYECINCGIVIDADFNAAINILHRGRYGSSTIKNSNL